MIAPRRLPFYRARRLFFKRDWRSFRGSRFGFEIANVLVPTRRACQTFEPAVSALSAMQTLSGRPGALLQMVMISDWALRR